MAFLVRQVDSNDDFKKTIGKEEIEVNSCDVEDEVKSTKNPNSGFALVSRV
jgi:hypothetical protein